jgi:FkbM family methyltransferase
MLRRLIAKVGWQIRKRIHSPKLHLEPAGNLLRLGTQYGGWTFEDAPDLHGSTIVSCGLGEDASFDVEFASRYGAKVIIVDPTPRAITHFNEFFALIGRARSANPVAGGRQPAESYDLRRVSSTSFVLIAKALWIERGTLKFYLPRDTHHVSHSIVNFQNNYSTDGEHIEVESVTIDQLMAQTNIDALPLLKLDIEGAEIPVIEDMLRKKIYPRQILVEFDELGIPSAQATRKFEETDAALRASGYRLVYFDGGSNCLYISSQAGGQGDS